VPYRFGDTQLRVVHSHVAREKNLLKKTRFVIVEHILPTTAEFLRLLKRSGADVAGVIAKPYSIDARALKAIKRMGINVVVNKSYKEIEERGVVEAQVQNAERLSDDDHRRIVLVDVGGYFAKLLAQQQTRHVAGVVEDTTFGYNRYKSQVEKIRVPILSVARSPLKEVEARFVGKDAVVAMDLILRDIGISISGRNALVIGYGMIGQNVARTLRRYDLKVFVYDKRDTMNLKAHADGYVVHRKSELVPKADIIFSATGSEAIYGKPALEYKEMVDSCRDDVVLASVGSRNTEFDVDQLTDQATKTEKLSDQLVSYRLTKNTNIHLARAGTAVNFYLPSIPIEILDLVFSEIVVGCLRLLTEPTTLALGAINESPVDALDPIAKDWLRYLNQL
jgi:adenosylhomocysteinase